MTQTDDPDARGDSEAGAVGTVAEEAAKLLGALSGWAREHGDGLHEGFAQGMSSISDDLQEHIATGSAECAWCPVCRTVAAVRQTSPEVKAHLTNAATSLALALSGLMNTRPPSPKNDVQRIRLDGDEDDEAWESVAEDDES